MERKATIFDLTRMCKTVNACEHCPISKTKAIEKGNCFLEICDRTEEVNDLIIDWYDKHPAKTLQSQLLAVLSTAPRDEHNVIDICPQVADKNYWAEDKGYECFGGNDCFKCRCAYWLELR